MTTSADLRIFFAFLIVSTTSFLPYNLFMNAHEYFYYKLRNLTGENVTLQEPNKNEHEHTHLQHVFEGYVAFSSGIFCILGALLNVLGTNRVSNSIRVIGGHAMVLIALVPTFALVFVNTDEMQVSFFWLTMALAAVSAFGSMGLIGGGIMGLAATFPEICMRAVLIGQALAGVVSAVLAIACQMFASNDLSNGRAYFAIALGWTVVSVLAYIYLVKSPHSAEMQFRALSASDRRPLIPETLDDPPLHPAQVDSLLVDAPENFMTACRTVLRQASIELMSGFLVLFVTLSAFPSVASLITTESMNDKWQDYFSAIYCFLVFNVGDAGGRLVGSHLKLRREILLCACLLRVIFPVLLCLCNVSPRLHPELVLIPHDGLFLLLMVLFSISNGALLTASGIAVAQSVPEEMREVAGSTFALVAATASFLGSLVGVLLVAIL